ncbi:MULTISPECIES: HD-GYP domain-containing protein [unclassified Paenibacillus]|uniref:HD-GYP domain-containing protein n=1 Tax=unclassified Paenibacillus TaxID=185978 RepID=UPI00363F7A4D
MAQVKIGVSIKKDIYNRVGNLLVPANTKLKEEDIRRLMNHRVDLREIEYWVQKDHEAVPDPVARLIEDASNQVKEIFEAIRYENSIPLKQIMKSLVPGIRKVAESANLFRLLSGLRSKDDYTYKHNIGVGVLATLIGKWMNLDENELSMLILGATLHDVGKMKVSNEILHKPGKLTDTEYRLMKRHTILGYEMLKNIAGTPHRVALIALQHHEREDGSGYPFGVKADKLDDLTQIVSIADVFHAMTSQRSYHAASSLFSVIRQMHSDVYGKFNAKIFFVFMNRMMESMVGNEALLTDGRKGTIVMANRFDPIRPLMKVDSYFIDLSKERSINLQEILG